MWNPFVRSYQEVTHCQTFWRISTSAICPWPVHTLKTKGITNRNKHTRNIWAECSLHVAVKRFLSYLEHLENKLYIQTLQEYSVIFAIFFPPKVMKFITMSFTWVLKWCVVFNNSGGNESDANDFSKRNVFLNKMTDSFVWHFMHP